MMKLPKRKQKQKKKITSLTRRQGPTRPSSASSEEVKEAAEDAAADAKEAVEDAAADAKEAVEDAAADAKEAAEEAAADAAEAVSAAKEAFEKKADEVVDLLDEE